MGCGIKSLAPICVEYFHWKIGGRVNLDNFVQLYVTKIEMKKTFYEKHWFLLIVHDEIDQMLTPCKKGLESVKKRFLMKSPLAVLHFTKLYEKFVCWPIFSIEESHWPGTDVGRSHSKRSLLVTNEK